MKVAVVGASGYTGLELLRILLRHPRVRARRGDVGAARGARRWPRCSPRCAGGWICASRPVDPASLAGARRARVHGAAARGLGARGRGAAQARRCRVRRPLGRLPDPRSLADLSAVVRRAPRAGAARGSGLRAARAAPRGAAQGRSSWPCPAAIRRRRCCRSRRFLREGLVETQRHPHRLEVRRLGRRPQARGRLPVRGARRELPCLQAGLRAPPRARDRAGGERGRGQPRCASRSCRTCCRRCAAS